MKKLILPLLFLAASFSPVCAEEIMYLIKGDQVVAKYDVDDIDYATFHLPEGVVDAPLRLSVDNVGKNNITYTVSATNQNTAYAHGIISEWDLWYGAMDNFGTTFDELDDSEKLQLLKAYLPYVAYLGIGTGSYTQTDWADDGLGNRQNVRPGTKYYLCAWQVDPVTQMPLDFFDFTDVSTLEPGESTGTLDITFIRQNAEGLAFDFSVSNNIQYIVVSYGPKSQMESFVEFYGKDLIMGVFGQIWTIDELSGMNPEKPEIENATWPIDGGGEYVLMARAVDNYGNVKDVDVYATAEDDEEKGPEISIFSRSKEPGKVSVNFEINPSNVEEAYVRMMDMNLCDDRLNMGYELHELATGGDAIDVTSDINRLGEYTFTSAEVPDAWQTLLIMAKDSEGKRTTLRMDFLTLEGSEWGDYNPVYKVAGKRRISVRPGMVSRRPVINKLK